jgi:hypothetical protein
VGSGGQRQERERERGEPGADRRARVAVRRGEGRTWAGLAVRERGEKGEKVELGLGDGPRAWPTREEKGEERGPRRGGELGRRGPMRVKESEKESWAGPKERVWAAFFYSLSFPFLYSNHSNKAPLNPNKFEFKPNTIKTMHQHECTIKLIL